MRKSNIFLREVIIKKFLAFLHGAIGRDVACQAQEACFRALCPEVVISVDIPLFNTPWGGLRVEDSYLITDIEAERLDAIPFALKRRNQLRLYAKGVFSWFDKLTTNGICCSFPRSAHTRQLKEDMS